MSITAGVLGEEPALAGDAADDGPAPKRIVVAYGFWIFLLSDIVMFATLFATYAVLAQATAGGPQGAQLFHQTSVAVETGCLLLSSYSCGLMWMAVGARNVRATYLGAVVTFALGAAFLALEASEFADMVRIGATPERSAFLSAFFTLVGCHGAARDLWPVVACRHDGAGGDPGLSPDGGAPARLLQPVLARARHHLGRAVHASFI